MKKLLGLLLFVVMVSGTPVIASDSESGGSGVGKPEIEDHQSYRRYYSGWICYSRYSDAFGWRNYYGWHTVSRQIARSNALRVCRANHWANPLGCYVTGCHWF